MRRAHDDEEHEIDADTGEEVLAEESELSAAALKKKLRELRVELATAQKERDEHLAGWQRAKADFVNFRRTVDEDRIRDTARQKGKLLRSIFPTLDSFEQAMTGDMWNQVDQEWREGVERIHSQLVRALEAEGLTAYGAINDVFDPVMHECVSTQETDEGEKDHTIAQVLQKGYKVGDEVVRAAKVVVYQTA